MEGVWIRGGVMQLGVGRGEGGGLRPLEAGERKEIKKKWVRFFVVVVYL